jgi:hypothetical protein
VLIEPSNAHRRVAVIRPRAFSDRAIRRGGDALAAAKARGVKLGGPKLAEVCRIGHRTQAEQADRFAANTRPVIEQIRKSGITSLRGIAAALNARGVPTARGGTWTPVQIMAIERRATDHGG